MKPFIILGVIAAFAIGGILWYAGFYSGQKSRAVSVKWGDVQHKMPELLERAGIPATQEQIWKLNREMTAKDAIGFKKEGE